MTLQHRPNETLAWRAQWESSHEPSLKQKLLTYNAEDCEATEKVTEALYVLGRTASSPQTLRTDVVNVDSLKREYPQRFGEVEFVLPDFQRINEASHWDYQRNRVYIRSNRRLRRLSRETLKHHPLAKIPVNKIIKVEEQRPAACPHCNSSLIYKWGRQSQVVYDLRFSQAVGIKRWSSGIRFLATSVGGAKQQSSNIYTNISMAPASARTCSIRSLRCVLLRKPYRTASSSYSVCPCHAARSIN